MTSDHDLHLSVWKYCVLLHSISQCSGTTEAPYINLIDLRLPCCVLVFHCKTVKIWIIMRRFKCFIVKITVKKLRFDRASVILKFENYWWRSSIENSMISRDIWHKYHEWYFKIVIHNFTSRWASEIWDNFEISRVALCHISRANHAISDNFLLVLESAKFKYQEVFPPFFRNSRDEIISWYWLPK